MNPIFDCHQLLTFFCGIKEKKKNTYVTESLQISLISGHRVFAGKCVTLEAEMEQICTSELKIAATFKCCARRMEGITWCRPMFGD